MKLVKKIISAVAAVAMTVSAFAAMTVYADAPTVTATATIASDKSYVDLTISYSGITGDNYAFGMDIAVDSTYFDVSDYPTSAKKIGRYAGDLDDGDILSTDLDDDQQYEGDLSWSNGVLNSKYSSADYPLAAAMDNLLTFRFPVVGGAESIIWTEGYTFTMTGVSMGKFAKADGLVINEATVGGDDEPTITQKTITTEDATDAAVYAFTEVAGATGQKLTVVANRNNEAEDITRTFTLPAKVEATVAVGIVVQYNPQEITSFTIKSMTIGE